MSELLGKYDYKNVLGYFEELTKIPHGSGNLIQIADFLENFCKENGVACIRDEANNILVNLPATSGYENRNTVIIQGHMDMVCEKDADCPHDFTKDPLELFVENGELGAKGTTLGGDDGIAIAYMMAIIADKELPHPALQLLMTTDEETGMFGAAAFDVSLLNGKYMINIDSEEEGWCFTGCAGGLREDCIIPVSREEVCGLVYDIKISGLLGGHSGVEIDKNRTNANKLMARLLFELDSLVGLYDVHGGKLDNAICREAFATVVVSKEDEKEFLEVVNKATATYKNELKFTEKTLDISIISKGEEALSCLDEKSRTKAVYFMLEAPNGVQVMSGAMPGLVESSLNMGVVKLYEDALSVRFSLRSSVSSYKYFLQNKLAFLCELLGGETESEGDYPAWEYKSESILRDRFKSLYEKEYGKTPVFQVMHAGLECGLISDKKPELDIISIGPDMKDVHSPNERLGLESAIRVFKFVEKLLINLD